jgi:hypothetical protein
VALRLYFDECVDARIIAGTRRRSIDSVTAADEGLLAASDEDHLLRATQLGRVVVSADEDFFRLVHARREAGLTFPGLLFVPNGTAVGPAVRGVEIAATVFDPADMVDQIEWVS